MQRNIDHEMQRIITRRLIVSALVTLVGLKFDLKALFEVPSLLRSGSDIGVTLLVLAAIALPWWGIWTFRRNMRWRSDLNEHPAFACPDFGTPAQVRQALQHVLNSPGAVKVGQVLVTADWMLQVTTWNIQAVYFPSVAWYYKHVTVEKYHGITAQKLYAFHLWTVAGKKVVHDKIPQAQVDQLLELAVVRAPGAISGYTSEAGQLWTSNREKFLQTVAYRKQCLAQEAQQLRATAPIR